MGQAVGVETKEFLRKLAEGGDSQQRLAAEAAMAAGYLDMAASLPPI